MWYLLFKALHIIAVIAWMAGLLYLPRLMVYHADAQVGGELSETLKIMERRLLRIIMTPAMVASWVFGLLLVSFYHDMIGGGLWLVAKIILVLILTGFHGILHRWTRDFEQNRNRRGAVFFRCVNEIPSVLAIVVVLLVVFKPF